MKALAAAVALVAAVTIVSAGQTPLDPKVQAQLAQLFPSATSFSPKAGEPPHFKALAGSQVTGYAF